MGQLAKQYGLPVPAMDGVLVQVQVHAIPTQPGQLLFCNAECKLLINLVHCPGYFDYIYVVVVYRDRPVDRHATHLHQPAARKRGMAWHGTTKINPACRESACMQHLTRIGSALIRCNLDV